MKAPIVLNRLATATLSPGPIFVDGARINGPTDPNDELLVGLPADLAEL
jgi:hypothetical protein